MYVCIYLSVQHMYKYMRRQIENAVHFVLQHSATYCNTLQHTTAHCNTLQHKTLCSVTSHTFVYQYIYIYTYVYMCMCVCVCLFVSVTLSLSLYIYVCVCMYIYMFISFICIHIHEWANRKRYTYVTSQTFVFHPICVHLNKYTCVYTHINICSSDLNTCICMD